MNKCQEGFALIESLLIALILAVIGFGGYYVWNTQKNVDKSSKDAVSASQSTSTASSTPKTQQKYMNITEWGVRVPYSGSDTFTYHYDSSLPNLIEVVSADLANKYNCFDIGAGLMSRSLPTDTPEFLNGKTVEQYANSNPGMYIKAGGHYYAWTHDQAACSETVTAGAQNQSSTAFENFAKNVETIPQ